MTYARKFKQVTGTGQKIVRLVTSAHLGAMLNKKLIRLIQNRKRGKSKMANGYDRQLEGQGDLSPKELRNVRDAYIAGQTDLSDKSAMDMAIALEYKRLEDYAEQQAKADKAQGINAIDWFGKWIEDAKAKAVDRIKARYARLQQTEATQETAKAAVDAFKRPLHLEYKHRF